MKDLKTRERFVELRANGWSYDKISKELSVSRNTLINWAKAMKIELANARVVAVDALLDTYKAQKEERVRFLAEEFQKAREELKSRRLDDLTTDKLLDFTLKLVGALKSDAGDISTFKCQTSHSELDEDFLFKTEKWEG